MTVLRSRLGSLSFCLALAACGSPVISGEPDGSFDAARSDAGSGPELCVTDVDCADGVFCNDVERCQRGASNADERGCVTADPGGPCVPSQTCDEEERRCVSSCPHAPDADGDGHRSVDCGGDDCDDADANRYPGNAEVCDGADHDEDCDPTTFGVRDVDGDLYADAQCCNTDGTSTFCGDDCNDSRPNVHPALPEACDGLDNDCDEAVDEEVERTFRPDVDGDGFGDASAPESEWMRGCAPASGYAEAGGDCDDAEATAHPGGVEQCDLAMLDENCDGTANPPSLCSCAGDVTRPCALPGQCAAGTERCIGGSWGLCSIAPTVEMCNGIDDDCDGSSDEELSVVCYPDGDNDGYAAAGATSVRSCPVPGRDAFAGCPSNQTNRAPLGSAIDCNDGDSTVSPGQSEICDSTLRDEDCDGVSNPPALCSCTDGASRPCVSSGLCGSGNQVCSTGRWSVCSVNPVTESCNAADDDCDGTIDEGLTVTCYADADNDGYAATGASALASCPVTGRDGVGGCPTNQTNRAPIDDDADCADTNAALSPGALEQCDGAMADEDCDGEANPASLCACSGAESRSCPLPGACAAGTETCAGGRYGSCSITPRSEACNSIDDDCDGESDEGLTVSCYADADNDGYAAAGATASSACPVPGREAFAGCPPFTTNRAPASGAIDCNDGASSVSPSAPEVCDGAMADEDCDGTANPASLCACSGSMTRSCPMPGACAAGSQTCVTGQWGACSIGPSAESCNSADDDCDGAIDEGLTVSCYADADNDGYAASGASEQEVCPVAGRSAVGGCPTNLTNRAPTGGNADCADMNAAVSPGASEQCDAAMVDENCDGTANPSSLCTCSGSVTRPCPAPGACASGTQTCNAGAWAVCTISATAETCNAIDDDCDGTVDDDGAGGTLMVTCYADGDSDGNGAGGTIARCPDPSRLAAPHLGCPAGFTGNGLDCNDGNASVRPGATEVCNGIDDDCDGTTDESLIASGCYLDGDGDGYASTSASASAQCRDASRMAYGYCPVGYTNTATDCNDGSTAVSPGASETCNGIDDDCDGSVDEALTASPCYLDADSDGYGAGAVSTRCRDAARSAFGYCPVGYTNSATDCNDGNASIRPSATELCNGIDDNCAGGIDEGLTLACYVDADADRYGTGIAGTLCRDGAAARAPYGYCPVGYSSASGDCVDSNAAVRPGATETCNGLDDDCDSSVDEGLTASPCYLDADGDGDGASGSSSSARCADTSRPAYGNCPAGYTNDATDCNDSNALVRVGATEVCNGADDNCDGSIDESVTVTFYRDADGDGFGCAGAACGCSSACTVVGCIQPPGYSRSSTDCDDAAAGRNPSAPEVCDAVDNDCDGSIDEGVLATRFLDVDGDGFGAGTGVQVCPSTPGYSDLSIDCNDVDANAFPGQSAFFPTAMPCPWGIQCGGNRCCSDWMCSWGCFPFDPWDYNCDGIQTREPTSPAACNGVCAVSPPRCGLGGYTYSGTPACGSASVTVTDCGGCGGGWCSGGSTSTRALACH